MPRRDIFYVVALIIFGILMYTLTLKGIYGNPAGTTIKNNLDQPTKPFELSPERDRFLLTESLALNHSFSLSQQLADAAYPDVGYINGKFYIFFAPGISLFALPLYELGSHFNIAQVATYSLSSFFALLSFIFLFKIGRNILKMPLWASLIAPVIFAFGSTSWSYAVTLYQHHATTFFIISGFYAVWKYAQEKRFSFLWGMFVWLNFGLAILIDYPNGILMAPVMIYFCITSFRLFKQKHTFTISFRPAFLLTSFFFILITLWHGYFNYTNFGSPLKLSGSLTGYKTIKEQKLFEKQNGQQKIKELSDKKIPIHFFKEDNFINGANTLLFSADRGILFYSPIFALAILGILYSIRQINTEIAILLGSVGADFFLYSSWGDPWGGYAFGSRYLIPAMAILSLFVAYWLTQVKKKLLAKILTSILFVYSAAISLLGVLTTNAIPPKVEAVYLHVPYNYVMNLQYLLHGKSSSFIYNNFFSTKISLIGYYFFILELVLLIFYIILFIVPIISRHEN